MKILNVEAKNFKKHSDVNMDFDGKSAVILGDTAQGKSTILEIIETCLMLRDMTDTPLKNGAESGYFKMITMDDGTKYSIRRTFSRGKKPGRFTVTNENGATEGLTNFLERIFGIAFFNQSFDYNRFFFVEKTSTARLNYFIKATGGEKIMENLAEVKTATKEREVIGGQKKIQESLLNASGFIDMTQEKMEADFLYYEKKREIDEADVVKSAYIRNNSLPLEDLEYELEQIDAMITMRNTIETEIISNETKIEDLQKQIEMIRKDNEQLDIQLKDANAYFDDREIEDAEAHKVKLEKEFEDAKKKNAPVNENAEKLYKEELEAIQNFNIKRNEFQQSIKALKEYRRLEREWEAITAKMNKLKVESEDLMKKNLPIPELSIKQVETEKGPIDVLFYKDVEFCWDAMSKGETVKVTAQIQKALNPKGLNFILIPEAQSMGSDIYSIMEEAQKFQLQVIMEYTQIDEKLQLVFVDKTKDLDKVTKRKTKRITK